MSFRARLTLVAAAAVALAVVAASVAVYFVVRNTLYSQVDNRLENRAEEITGGPGLRLEQGPGGNTYVHSPRGILGSEGYIQIVRADGDTFRTFDEVEPLPVPERALETAKTGEGTFFVDSKIGNADVRVYTTPIQDFAGTSYALQIAQDLADVNTTLDTVTIFLVIIAIGGIGIAVALGLLVSRAALAPVSRLTDATERVASTQDLSERIDTGGRDELSRLAASFNTMLGALEESTLAQRQLVADASHELRTPLTSLRTNIEVLASDRELPPGERERLLSDVVEQLGEMTNLISELIELARGEEPPKELEDVRLDLVAAEAVERTRRNRPGVSFKTDFEESARARRPGDDRSRRRQLAGQRGEVEPARRPGRDRGSRRRGDRSRPRAWDRGRGSAVCLRPLLSRAVGPRPAGLGPRARDRQAGRRGSRRDSRRRAPRRRRHRSCASASTAPAEPASRA